MFGLLKSFYKKKKENVFEKYRKIAGFRENQFCIKNLKSKKESNAQNEGLIRIHDGKKYLCNWISYVL